MKLHAVSLDKLCMANVPFLAVIGSDTPNLSIGCIATYVKLLQAWVLSLVS